MKLTCKINRTTKKVVQVQPEDQLNILLNKLNIGDKKAKFVYKGYTYSLATIFTFKEIGLTTDTDLNIVTPARAGISK